MKLNIPTIGLIGGIGAGKSVVAKFLEDLGCVVANADDNANNVWKQQDVLDQVLDWWGSEVLLSDGSVNRSKIASIVFQEEQERARLEELLHPKIRALQDEQFDAAPAETTAYVIDAPLLIEAGLEELCDALIFVDTSKKIRASRVQETRGWDTLELERREAVQIPLDMKRLSADYVVCNEGSRGEALSQIQAILKNILGQFKTN